MSETVQISTEEAVERLELLTAAIGMDPHTRAALTLAITRLSTPPSEELVAAALYDADHERSSAPFTEWAEADAFVHARYRRLARAAILSVEGGN